MDRLNIINDLMQIGTVQRVPEGRPPGNGVKSGRKLRIEPGSRTVFDFLACRIFAIGLLEHVSDLRNQRDTGIKRNGVPGHARGLAIAVPMFVQIANALRNRFAETHLAGNVGTPLAPRLNELRGNLAAILKNIDDGPEALGKARLQSRMAQYKAQGLRQAAINKFEISFEFEVIDQIELANPRRVAAAAQVFEQQRVIELPYLQLIQLQLFRNLKPDPAAAQAMPLRLALRDIEGMAEGTEQFRQADFGNR